MSECDWQGMAAFLFGVLVTTGVIWKLSREEKR
jgi:hypothetical protein